MQENPARVKEIQTEVIEAIGVFSKEQHTTEFLKGFFSSLKTLKEEGKEKSYWDIVKLVIFSKHFWLMIANHIPSSITLFKCGFKQEYKNVINESAFAEKLLNYEEIKDFYNTLSEYKDDILVAIAYFQNLPENDEDKLLDQAFLKELVNFLETNKEKIDYSTLAEISGLFLQRSIIEKTTNDPQKLQENAIALARKSLGILSEIKGIDKLIGSKTNALSKLLAESISVSGVSLGFSEDQMLQVVNNCIDSNNLELLIKNAKESLDAFFPQHDIKAQEIVRNFENHSKKLQSAVEMFLRNPIEENKTQLFEIANEVFNKNKENIEKLKLLIAEAEQSFKESTNTAIVNLISLASNQLYPTLDAIKGIPIGNFCVEIDIESSEAPNKVVYKLNELGKTLYENGLLKLKNSDTVPELWKMEVNGEIEFKQHNIIQKVGSYFRNNEKRIKSVKVEKDVFDNAFNLNVNVNTAKALLPKLIESKGLLQSFSTFFDKDVQPMVAAGMVLQQLIQVDSNNLMNELIAQREQICTLLKTSMPKEILNEFGLEESFLNIIPTLLSKKENFESIYYIICHMNGENNPDMVNASIELLQNNPEINDFLNGKDIQTQIVNLVKALTKTVPLMSEFFSRTEFKLLSDNLTSELQSVLLSVLDIGTSQELTRTLITNMEVSNIINGLMFHKDSSSVKDRLAAEAAAKEVYLFIINDKDESAWNKIQESAGVLGIKSYDELKARIESAKIYIAANKLHNEIFALTRFDDKDDQRKKDALNLKKTTIIGAIRSSKNLSELSAKLKDKLSPSELSFIKIKFNEYKTDNEKLLFERLAYETQINPLEKEFDKLLFSNIHSNALFYLCEKIEGAENDFNKEEFKLFLKNNSLVLSEEQQNSITDAVFGDQESIKASQVKVFLSDLSCRKKGAEDIGNIQQMLTSLLAPFAQISDRPFNESEFTEVRNVIVGLDKNKTEWNHEEIEVKLKENEYFNNNPYSLEKVLNKLFVVMNENGSISTEDLETALELMLKDQKEAATEHKKTQDLINKIVLGFSEDELKSALNKVVLEKGSPESISKLTIALLNAVAQYTEDERSFLIKNILPKILNNVLLPDGTTLDAKSVAMIKVAANEILNDPNKLNALSDIIKKGDNFVRVKNQSGVVSAVKELGISGVFSGLKAAFWNLSPRSAAMSVWNNWGEIEHSKLQPEELNELIEKARVEGQHVDVRGILRRHEPDLGHNALCGKDLSTVNFLGTQLKNIDFAKTKLPKFNDVKFEKCNFRDSELINSKFENVTFDVESFNSLYTTSKSYVKISKQFYQDATREEMENVMNEMFGKDVKVVSELCGRVDIKLFAVLSEIYSEKDPKKFDELLLECIKEGITYDNLQPGVLEVVYGQSVDISKLTLKEIKNAKTIIEKNGLTIEILKNQFSPNTEMHLIHKTLIDNISRVGLIEDEVLDDYEIQENNKKNIETLKNIKKFSEEKIEFLNEMLDDYTSNEQLSIVERISKHVDKVNNLTEEQITDLIAYFADNGKNIEYFITILESEKYENIKFIAEKLDTKKPWRLYEELNPIDNNDLTICKDWLNENPIVEGRNNAQFNQILTAWYVQRVQGNQNPQKSRRGDLTQVGCLKKALEYHKNNNSLASSITHKIVNNLFDNRIFNTPDRMHDAQRIYDSVIDLIKGLSPETQQLLQNEKNLEVFVGDKKSGILKLLYDKSKYEGTKLKKDLYLPEDLNIENTIKLEFTNEYVMVAAIIAKYGETKPVINSKIHTQLSRLNENELKIILGMDSEIAQGMISYCIRSNVEVKDMMNHTAVLEQLNTLSNELKIRYELIGDKKSEEFCLQLVVKLYNDVPQVKELIKDDHTMLANMIFIKLQDLHTGKPPVKLENLEVCKNAIQQLFKNEHTKELSDKCNEQGQKIAEQVFEKLQIANVWNNTQPMNEAKKNLANLLASRMFSTGKIIEDKDLEKFIGESKQGEGIFAAKYAGSNGFIKVFNDIFYAKASLKNPWYEIPVFDSKDNHTIRLVKGIDVLLVGKNQIQSQSFQI